jgi:hypothetical protein
MKIKRASISHKYIMDVMTLDEKDKDKLVYGTMTEYITYSDPFHTILGFDDKKYFVAFQTDRGPDRGLLKDKSYRYNVPCYKMYGDSVSLYHAVLSTKKDNYPVISGMYIKGDRPTVLRRIDKDQLLSLVCIDGTAMIVKENRRGGKLFYVIYDDQVQDDRYFYILQHYDNYYNWIFKQFV